MISNGTFVFFIVVLLNSYLKNKIKDLYCKKFKLVEQSYFIYNEIKLIKNESSHFFSFSQFDLNPYLNLIF